MQTSIFTVCTPWAPLPVLLPQMAAAGYDGVEVAFRDRPWDPTKPPNFWGNNAAILDWDHAVDEADALLPLVQQHGLRVASLGSYADCRDQARCLLTAQTAQRLHCPTARVRMPWYDATVGASSLIAATRNACRELAAMAGAHGMCFLVEIHPSFLCPSASAAMRIVEGLPSEHIGVIFDPGNMMLEGSEAFPYAIDLLGPYLKHVHVKDTTIAATTASDPKRMIKLSSDNRPLGCGIVDWPAIIAELKRRKYAGYLSIKDFDASNDGPAAMARAAAWLRGCMS